MRVLLTSTSFQDTPGIHHEILNSQNFSIDKLRGPVSEAVLMPIIDKYDAVICGDDEYTENVIKKGKEGNLKYISKYGVGLDKIDLKAAKKFDIPVTNCPGVNQVSVAEHVLALLFTFEKNIHLQFQSTKEGSWERMTGNEIQGKKIGIIGLGAIGKVLAKKSLAMGLDVCAYDITYPEEFLQDCRQVHFVNHIDEIFKEADIISLHLPHTPNTERLIDREVIFDKMKRSPILINTSRGKLVDTNAVIDGLNKSRIRGYLTDVLDVEPISENEKLKDAKNVIITPHVGSRTYQSVERQGIMAVENLLNLVSRNAKNI